MKRIVAAGPLSVRLLASTILASAMFAAAPAFAQDAEPEAEAEAPERILVTGTRLQTNPNLAGAVPVLSVGADDIDARGNIRIEEIANILPSVFAGQATEVSNGATGTSTLNLRGLGDVRTLVLIDGRRLPYGSSGTSAANLDLVPAQLVERFEVLTGGASAVYGSDAVGGVANFILKRDFEGFELDVQGATAHNGNGVEPFDSVLRAASITPPDGSFDGEEVFINFTLGANTPDGRGNVTLFGSYENRGAISQADRSISACALGQDTGPNSFAGFGCVGSANFRLLGGPGGFTFVQEDGEIVPFAGGPAQTFNFGPFNFFQRPSERFQIYARGHYELDYGIEAFADLSFTNNSSDAQIAPSASFGIGAFDINCDNPLIQGNPGVPLTDVFGCSAEDIANGTVVSGITASHRNVEGGARNSFLDNTAWRFVGGFRGTVLEHWSWEAFGQFSRTQDTSIATNDFITANVQQAFLARADENGNVVCIDPSGGCVPFNPFQRGPNGESLVTSEQTDFLQGIGIVTGTTQQIVTGASAQADLSAYGVKSPFSQNGVGFLFGVEYRQDELESIPDEISQIPGGGFTGVGGATLPVAGQINVLEGFTEVQVPIVTERPFFEQLTLSGRYRFSDYEARGNDTTNDFTTNSYSVDLVWQPYEDLRFRGQFQRAVRAPNVIELFTGQNTNLPNLSPAGVNANGVQLFDPCASSAPIASFEECARTGVTAAQFGTILDVISGQTQSLTGGNPELDPEVADTFTGGFIYTPSFIPDLTLSVDYFNITVEEAIQAGIPAQTIFDNCLATGDAAFCELITRAPSGTLAAGTFGVGFQQTNINIGELKTQGVDFQINYSFDLAEKLSLIGREYGDVGELVFSYVSTYLDQIDTTPFPGAEVITCAGEFGNECGTPAAQYRHVLNATWVTPWNIDTTATWRYFGGTDNDNPAEQLETRLDTVNYFDLSGNWQATDHLAFRAGALNVLNAQAPVFSGAGPALGNGNTFPTVFDTGRFIFVGATLRY